MLKALLLHLTNLAPRAKALAAALALAAMAMAQNLVLNGSFEDTTYCLGWPQPQLEAVGWHTANTATPDIWNCDTLYPCGYSVMDPNDGGIQIQGYKFALEGDRFAGGYHWYGYDGSNTRDYLTSKLQQTLAAGQSYRVSVWCARPWGYNGVIDHIGVYFGPDSVYAPYPTTLPYTPQAELRDPLNTYIQDTSWIQLVDTFTATGDEQWVILGTFNDANDVNGIWLGWGSFPPKAYYYLDQLEVVPVVPLAIDPLDVAFDILTVDGDWIKWQGLASPRFLWIYDTTGALVWTRSVDGAERGPWILPERLSAGVYLLRAATLEMEQSVRFVK